MVFRAGKVANCEANALVFALVYGSVSTRLFIAFSSRCTYHYASSLQNNFLPFLEDVSFFIIILVQVHVPLWSFRSWHNSKASSFINDWY